MQDLNSRSKRTYEQDADERDTRITTLQSKVSVAEMREGHLLQQVQEVSQARDILSRDLNRCMSELSGSRGEEQRWQCGQHVHVHALTRTRVRTPAGLVSDRLTLLSCPRMC
jgi:hypothetical protein